MKDSIAEDKKRGLNSESSFEFQICHLLAIYEALGEPFMLSQPQFVHL